MSNSKPLDTLNEQMNLLVESQAQDIKELHEQLKTMAECSDAGMLVNVDGDCIHNLKEENEKLKKELVALSKMNDKKHRYHKNKCEEVKKLKQEVEQKKDAWDGHKVLEDLLENTNYTPETTFIEYIQKLEKENENLKREMDEVAHKVNKLDDIVDENNDLKTDRDTMLESCGDLDNMEDCVGYVNDLKEDNENLKKDYDKNWAAMECLSFMDYKYEDGEWKPYED